MFQEIGLFVWLVVFIMTISNWPNCLEDTINKHSIKNFDAIRKQVKINGYLLRPFQTKCLRNDLFEFYFYARTKGKNTLVKTVSSFNPHRKELFYTATNAGNFVINVRDQKDIARCQSALGNVIQLACYSDCMIIQPNT